MPNPAAVALAAIILGVPAVPVNQQACPDQALEAGGCYYPPPTDQIYVDPQFPPATQDVIMWHERGHAADIHFLADGERHRFTCLPALRTSENISRCGQPWGPQMREFWADAYASCHFRDRPSRGISHWRLDLQYWPGTDRRQVNACRFIGRATTN